MQAPTREAARRGATSVTERASALARRVGHSRLARPLRSRDLLIALAGGLLALLFGWQALPAAPRSGLDPSWTAALHLAAQQGKDFGPEVVYTYGPLGFLKVPTWWGTSSGALAVVYAVVTRLALLVVVFAIARRSFGLPVAAVLALVVSDRAFDPVIPLAFAGALWVVLRAPGDRRRFAVLGALGVLAGLESLAKISTGATLVAMGVLAAFSLSDRRERLRGLAAFGGPALGTGLLAWLLAGQPLAALPEWVARTGEIVGGYASAMSLDPPQLGWQHTAALLSFGLGAAGLWWLTDGAARGRRAGVLSLWAVLSWLSFKQGFVRQDLAASHVPSFFAMLFVALAVVPWKPGLRRFAVAAIVVPFVALQACASQRLRDLVDPLGHFERARTDLAPLLSSDERRERVAWGELRVRAETGVEPQTLALLEGRRVDVWPTETSIVAAYDLEWQPLPVFQNYQAYTAELDDVNADALLGDDPPERVLVGAPPPLDNRIPAWDPPRQTRSAAVPLPAARPDRAALARPGAGGEPLRSRAPDRVDRGRVGPEGRGAAPAGARSHGDPAAARRRRLGRRGAARPALQALRAHGGGERARPAAPARAGHRPERPADVRPARGRPASTAPVAARARPHRSGHPRRQAAGRARVAVRVLRGPGPALSAQAARLG